MLIIAFWGCSNLSKNLNYSYLNTDKIKNIKVPKSAFNCSCHTQGVGWDKNSESIVVTCQGENESYITLFKLNTDSSKLDFQSFIQNDADGRGYSHPSAIQIHNDFFSVAITEGRRDSSFIYFYSIQNNKIENTDLKILSYPRHIGATGMAEWNQSLYLMGLGWDSKYYALWKSDSTDNIDFELLSHGKFSDIVNDKYGPYNSIWFGSLDNSELLLFATYGSFSNKLKNFMDIFAVDIKGNELSINLQDRIRVKGITKGTTKSLFYEGFTIKDHTNDTITILSTPQDFINIATGETVLKALYEGVFIKKVYVE